MRLFKPKASGHAATSRVEKIEIQPQCLIKFSIGIHGHNGFLVTVTVYNSLSVELG